MAYTVKKLSELSGVTVRALHFYEEANLLKPAYYGSNGYRYYEEKELLQLQQILFFKELGFTLNQIRKVLGRSDFDLFSALLSHKKALSQEWDKIGRLLKTIDYTIKHIKGQKNMKDKEFFNGFSLVTRGKGNESYFAAETIVLSNLKEGEPLKAVEREEINQAAHEIFKKLAACMEKGLEPASDEVQRIIGKHHALIERFHIGTREVYQALAKLYQEHPEFRKQIEPVRSDLPEFMAKAMIEFAQRKLK